MRPREQSKGQDDLFRSRLDQIIDMKHELVRLAGQVNWPLLGQKLGDMYTDGPGQPPLPTRLMAGLSILKHTFDRPMPSSRTARARSWSSSRRSTA